MPRLANLAVLLAAIAPALATTALSDGQYSETVGPQQIGSTALYGTMIYSMNYCSITHSTRCYTSLSTGGPAYSSIPGSSSAYSPPVPTYGPPGETVSTHSSIPVPTPGPVTSGTVGYPPSTTTVVSSGTVPGGETTSSPTAPGSSSYSTTQTPSIPTGAGVMGAAAMGNVFVAALAALAV